MIRRERKRLRFAAKQRRSIVTCPERASSGGGPTSLSCIRMVEQITGALFVAILVAKLAGAYPPRESYVDENEK